MADKITEDEAMRFEVLTARKEALQAKIEALDWQGVLLREQLTAKYSLDPVFDSVDLKTREITRGPRPAPPIAEPPAPPAPPKE